MTAVIASILSFPVALPKHFTPPASLPMSGVQKKSWEGDLFPRGAAPTATPRVRKRDGQVLFTPSAKRQRTRPIQTDDAEQPVTRHGAMLSASRVVAGMTLLAIVTRADNLAVWFALPGGLRAVANAHEVLIAREDGGNKSGQRREQVFRGAEESENASDSDSDSASEVDDGGSDSEAEGVCALWEVVKVGDVVRVAVVSVSRTEKSRFIEVSVKPELVNATLNPSFLLRKGFGVVGVIRSVEDHGCVVSFGAHIEYTGFLEQQERRVGKLVEVVTLKETKKSKRGVVKVGTESDIVLSARAGGELGYTDLRAGMLLKGVVAKRGDAGVALKVCGILTVAVDAAHVREGDVEIGKSVMVRLIYVDGVGKRVVGTMLDSWVDKWEPRAVPEGWKVGMKMERLRVEAIKPGFGLAMRFVEGEEEDEKSNKEAEEDVVKGHGADWEERVPVLAHISCISDAKNVKLESLFHQGMTVSSGARVVSVSRVDGVVNVDMRPSILKRKALSIDEIEEGSLYDCRIMNHTTIGSIRVAVDGDPRLLGSIPASQISDVPITSRRLASNPKFQVGAILKCRALFVNLDKGRVILSAKSSVVTAKHPLLTSFEQAERALEGKELNARGTLFTGHVTKVLPSCAVVVGFCGQIAGLVPTSELCVNVKNDIHEMRAEVENLYPVGQTVHVRVIKVDSKIRRMWLSMDLRIKGSDVSPLNFELGTLVHAVVSKVDDAAKHLVVTVPTEQFAKIQDNNEEMKSEIENLPSANENRKVECHLPFGHLSDVSGIAEKLVREIKNILEEKTRNAGEAAISLRSLLLLSIRDGVPTLSLKPSLKAALLANQLPRSFSEVRDRVHSSGGKAPTFFRGYVKALLPTGVIVGFLGDAVGFVRIARIADHFISDPARALKIDQSVAAVVESVDDETNRFSLSLRLSDTGSDGLADDTLSLFSSFESWQKVLQKPGIEAEFPIGSLIDVSAGKEHTYGYTYNLKYSGGYVTGVALNVSKTGLEITDSEGISIVEEKELESKRGKKQKKQRVNGEKLKDETLRILDVDPFSGVVDLSRDEAVVEGGRKKSILNTGSTFSATVLLVKSGYLIVAVARSKTRSTVAFALGPAVSDNLAIQPGTLVQCTVLDKSLVSTQRNLVLIDWKLFRSSTLQKTQKVMTQKKESELSQTFATLLSSDGSDLSTVVGKKIVGKVTQRFLLHEFLSIARGIVGHLHITNVSRLSDDEISNLPLGPVPNEICSRFTLPGEGTKLNSPFVAGIRRVAEDVETGPMIVEVSLTEEGAQRETLTIGQKVLGFIKNLSTRLNVKSEEDIENAYSFTKVAVSPNTVAACKDVDCLFAEDDLMLKVGTPVMCLITGIEGEKVWATMTQNGTGEAGKFFKGIVLNVIPGMGIKVEIPWHARPTHLKSKSWGIIGLCDVDSDFGNVSNVLKSLSAGDVISVRRVNFSSEEGDGNDDTWLSMRSRDGHARDPLIAKSDIPGLKEGAKVRGIVKAISKKGCFVAIGRDVTAQVQLCDLADDYVKSPEASFPVGTVVEGVIDKLDHTPEKVRISLVLRKRPRKSLKENFEEGQKVEGVVKRVAGYGALVELSEGATALLHKSEADQDRYIENPVDEWIVGQRLAAIVIGVDEKGIKIGTKRCYFEAAGFDDEQTEVHLAMNEKSKSDIAKGKPNREANVMSTEEENNQHVAGNDTGGCDITSDEDDGASNEGNDHDNSNGDVMMVDDTEVGDESVELLESITGNTSRNNYSVTPLDIGQSFNFNYGRENGGGNEKEMEKEEKSESEKKDIQRKKTSHDKREKKRQREAAERAIRLREEALANNPDSPETADDFERLLVGEPNSSVLWIRYMAFCLSLSQVDKARSIAERAIDTISLDRDTDRTNIWIAYMNLEAKYGASNALEGNAVDNLGFKRDAAVFRVFDRGCERVTDVKNFHLQAAIALRSTDPELEDEVLRRAIRRFKGSKKVWIASGLAQFKAGNKAAARRTLEKALVSLEKRKHVEVIAKFAQFEYKFGSPERGRTVFESLAGNFPKRLDLWNIYLDMETAQCRQATDETRDIALQSTRRLFERVTTLQFSTKKMKFLFQKWLSFEKIYGNIEQRGEVKNRARAYVERSVTAKE